MGWGGGPRVPGVARSVRLPCATRDSCMNISLMWQHIKCKHRDTLARAQSNIKDATQRRGFKQRGGILHRYFKACHLFEAKLALQLPYPYFPLSFLLISQCKCALSPSIHPPIHPSLSLALCSHLCQPASFV